MTDPAKPDATRSSLSKRRLKLWIRLLGVTVHDHVVIGREGHVSLRAKGLI